MFDKSTNMRPLDIERSRRSEAKAMVQISIRRAEVRDITAVHVILTSAHVIEGSMRVPHAPLSTTEDRLKEHADRVQLVAETDGEVVGFAEVLTDFANPRGRHAAILNMIATREDMQSQGVCTALLEAIVELCRDHWGLRRLGLIVWSDNTLAIKLYEANGFRHEGVLKDYVRSGAIYKDAHAMARIFPKG
ncbi:putative acetyltransferase YhhY [Roseovarius albus]|uniref:Putative acetyltransferase YhhY n=1 Tax=Roseovarius albus TaxID=1247867 RepID=A0A1X7A4M1_9RHOB|nr:GNAT family N-acetyltransferase [Roseovarius albus]SLN69988.1 putative acetyltransferase YhhY [Roseovarius albus]